jgi:hypothetical protein
MPKYCPDCGETKSKTSFVKGKIVCKDCDRDRLSSIAPSTVDGTVSTPNTMDMISGAISKILERLDASEERSRNISIKLDELKQSIGSLKDTSHTDIRNTQDVELQNISARLDTLEIRSGALEEISFRLGTLEDMPRSLQDISVRLRALEEVSARLDASNALRNLSARLTPVHVAESSGCSAM